MDIYIWTYLFSNPLMITTNSAKCKWGEETRNHHALNRCHIAGWCARAYRHCFWNAEIQCSSLTEIYVPTIHVQGLDVVVSPLYVLLVKNSMRLRNRLIRPHLQSLQAFGETELRKRWNLKIWIIWIWTKHGQNKTSNRILTYTETVFKIVS